MLFGYARDLLCVTLSFGDQPMLPACVLPPYCGLHTVPSDTCLAMPAVSLDRDMLAPLLFVEPAALNP